MESSPRLPPEISDRIIDLLRDETNALKRCCLVSKSWVSRTRKHLFDSVEFESSKDVKVWKETFPDPANSPARHTRSLSLVWVEAVIPMDPEEGSWIRAFSNVVQLTVWNEYTQIPPSKFSILICSLPLLEDLEIMCCGIGDSHENDDVSRPSFLPPLTGTLDLSPVEGLEKTTRHLLDLQVCSRFRSLKFTWSYEEDFQWITALIEECSDVLECISIDESSSDDAWEVSADLSKAKKLREVTFYYSGYSVAWVAATLKTITSEHQDLRNISIGSHALSNNFDHQDDARTVVENELYEHWMDLDRTLIQLWESHAIRVRITYFSPRGERKRAREFVGGLLPEATEKGVVKLVNLANSRRHY